METTDRLIGIIEDRIMRILELVTGKEYKK